MNEIILKRLSLYNGGNTNENIKIEAEFKLPGQYSTESTLNLTLTDDQARRIVSSAMDSIKEACVTRLEAVRADMINVLDMKELAAAPPTEEPANHPSDTEGQPLDTPENGSEPSV